MTLTGAVTAMMVREALMDSRLATNIASTSTTVSIRLVDVPMTMNSL